MSYDPDIDEDDELADQIANRLASLGIDLVPFEWNDVFCGCPAPVYNMQELHDNPYIANPRNDGTVRAGQHWVCVACRKRPRWQLMRCTECGQYYDWWFYHPAIAIVRDKPSAEFTLGERHKGWAWARRICWNCIIKVDPGDETNRPPQYLKAPKEIHFSVSDDIFDF
jgi:hypothetical protein